MKTKSNFSLKRIVSLILAFAMLFTITVSLDFSVFAASCKHNPSAGNSGKWFNSISECDDYWADVLEVWDEKYESGEVTYVEWVEGHPGGYSAWTCYYCQMWTVDFFYREKTCNHKWSEETTVFEPTCVERGSRERYCLLCDMTYDRILPAFGHDIKQTVTPATPVSEGYMHSECTRCGFVFGDYSTPKTVEMSRLPFIDLSGYDDYSGYVAYTSLYNSFITGSNPPVRNMFSPKDSITRAMLVTILYRMAGEPYKNANPYKVSPFTDIKDKSVYYYDAACRALDKGITTQTTFKPYDPVTRQQTAAFLFRYAQGENLITDTEYLKVDLTQYPDYWSMGIIINDVPQPGYYPGVAEWAVESLQWANYNGMITGTQQGYINPIGATQRIHATKILYGFGKACNIDNFV